MNASPPDADDAPPDEAAQAQLLPVEQQFERVLAESLPEPEARSVATKLTTIALQAEMFAGPLPPPQIIEGYERAIPGLGERVVKMAEGEQAFRHSLANRQLDIEDRNSWRGLHYGAAVAVLLVICATVCAYIDQPWVATAMMAAAAVSMVPALLNGWRDKHQLKEAPQPPSELHESPQQDNGA